MTTHPEISHIGRDERIRAIAYELWEEEGRPEGRAEAHWLRASELVDAEAEPVEESPDWLQRIEPPPALAVESDEPAEPAEPAEQIKTVADIARKFRAA